jgi:hypothetical protein
MMIDAKRTFSAAGLLVALGLGVPTGRALAAERTQVVVPGARYQASATHRWFFGNDYRALWTAPLVVEVLDLQAEAGGLSIVRRIGGQQTKGLALKGKDGRNYTFRGLEKDPSEILEEDLRGTVVEDLLEDQMAAQYPGSELVARGLLDAAGIPCPPWRLVVLPDDEALGEFRKDFAGAVGTFAEYPSTVSETNPGYRGATEIVDHLELYKRLEAGEGDRADTPALLKARLVDVLMGDWDRHRKQWRWARFPGSPLWQPIPEDRDQAFSRYEGLALGFVRMRDDRLQDFGPGYPGIGGLTSNGREQDRRLLVGLTQEQFRDTATALKAQLGDAEIEKAVALLPAEWQRLDGARLTRDLKARRDALTEIAVRYYRHLAERVDVYTSHRPERVEARRVAGGDLEVAVRPVGAGGEVGELSYQRVFHPGETREVRLYTLGGDDRVTVSGGRGSIRVRVVGGAGGDLLDDRDGGGSRLSDSEGRNAVESGPGTSHDARPYTPPPPPRNAPWIPPRDFGHETWGVPWLGFGADVGAFVGWGVDTRSFAFRRHPYSRRHVLRAGYSFGEKSGRVEYLGDYRRENRASHFGLHAYASGIELLRFYGFGNDSVNRGDRDFLEAKEQQYLLRPSMAWPLGNEAELSLGPVLRYSQSERDQGTLIEAQRPYGFGDFGQVGARAVLSLDSRDRPAYPRRGVFLAARGTYWPKLWDVDSGFGEIDAAASAYLSAGNGVTLALRAGGEQVLGDAPFRDAAYLGGGGLPTPGLDETGFTLRGFRARRFAGDAAVYGNADLRLRLGQLTLVLPMHVGVFGLADAGRVFLDDETSDSWHTSVGGGLWISFFDYRNTISAYVAHSKEDDIVHVGAGFTF